MESLTYLKTDPSTLLHNEIEILLTQIHLMELYIKQAQATAANEAARHREEQQAELVALRAELERKEQDLNEYRTATSAIDQTLNEQLQTLQTRLETNEQLLHTREHELEEANSEIRSLRECVAHVESEIRNRDAADHEAEGVRQGLQSELTSLRSELEAKNAELLRFQATTREHEVDWNSQLHQLQSLLAEKQGWLQAKEVEFEQAKAEIARLAECVSDQESAASEARVAAARELELTRAKLLTDLDAVHAQLRSKEDALQDREGAIAALDAQRTAEIDDLRRELRESTELLEHRQRELQDFQSQSADLHERMAALEAEAQQAVAALESTRKEAATELAQAREELQQKERLLAEHQSAVTALEQSNQDRLRALEQQLTEKTNCLETSADELETSKAEISVLRGRIAEIEAGQKEAQSLATHELERTRESFHAELADLQAQIDQKERILQDRDARFAEIEQLLQLRTQELGNLLEGKQQQLEDRERELEDLRAQFDAQKEINGDLNSANERWQVALTESESLRQGLVSELSNLRDDIGQKEKSLAEREAFSAAAEQSQQEQVQELQCRLLERQAWLESKERELERAQTEAAALRAQVSQLESEIRDIEPTATSRAEQVHEQLQSELVELRDALKVKEGLLHEREAMFASIEGTLNTALDRLRTELTEKQNLLDRGYADLEHARSEIDALRQQNSELELLNQQTERLLSVQGEQIRACVRTEIEALETQMRERDALLLAARSQFDELQGNFESKVNELQCELADKQFLNDSRAAEIDDLKSQVNLALEQSAQETISFQQTEAALNGEITRMRQSHEAELTALREELGRNRTDHEEWAASIRTSEHQLRLELSDLRAQLTGKENILDVRERDLEITRGELAAAHEKLAFLESSHREEKEAALGETNRAETALRAELAAKDRALEECNHTINRLEYEYRGQTDRLHDQVTELRRLLDVRNAELADAKDGAEQLRRRLAGLEAAADEIGQTKQEAQAAVATLQADLTLRTTALHEQELTAKRQEQTLQKEITALRTEAREKHILLESRNEELVRVKAELDRLQECVAELKWNAKRAEEAAATENETMRRQFQAQIAYLQAELSQKDWALADRQAVRRAEPTPHLQHQERSTQESAAPRTSEKRDKAFILGEPQITETGVGQSKKLDDLIESAKAKDGQRFAPARQRRWHAGWSWKRRWKSS